MEIGRDWAEDYLDGVRLDRWRPLSGPVTSWAAERIRRELRALDAASPLAIAGNILAVAAQVARHDSSTHDGPVWLRLAEERLRDEWRAPPTVKQLAEVAGVHPVHFARAFRPLIGCTPGECVRRMRIAFGEELAYRGSVLERAAALGRHSTRAYVPGMLAGSLLFGLGHFYQGPAGMVNSALSGLFFGALYLASGRNLWLPIPVHGLSDAIGLALIYFGLVPELRG